MSWQLTLAHNWERPYSRCTDCLTAAAPEKGLFVRFEACLRPRLCTHTAYPSVC